MHTDIYAIPEFWIEARNSDLHRSTCYKTLLKAGRNFQKGMKKGPALVNRSTLKNPLVSGKAISTAMVMMMS